MQCIAWKLTQLFISLSLIKLSAVPLGTAVPFSWNPIIYVFREFLLPPSLNSSLLLPEDSTSILLSVSFCLYMSHLPLSCCLFYHYWPITPLICLTDIIINISDLMITPCHFRILSLGTVFFSTLSTVITPGNSNVFRDNSPNNWCPSAHCSFHSAHCLRSSHCTPCHYHNLI